MSEIDGVPKEVRTSADGLVALLGLQDIIFGGAFLYVYWTLNKGIASQLFLATPYEPVNVALLVIASALVGKLHSLANGICAGIIQAMILRTRVGELKNFPDNLRRAQTISGATTRKIPDERIRGSDVDWAAGLLLVLAPQLQAESRAQANHYQMGYTGFLGSLLVVWYVADKVPNYVTTLIALSVCFLLYAVAGHIDFLFGMTRALGIVGITQSPPGRKGEDA
jgi:hypothetical protein